MLTPAEIKEKLKDRIPTIVAEESGVHVNTIRKLKTGISKSPSYKTMQKVSAYFEKQQANG